MEFPIFAIISLGVQLLHELRNKISYLQKENDLQGALAVTKNQITLAGLLELDHHLVTSSFSIVINCAKINVSLIKSNGLAENPVLYSFLFSYFKKAKILSLFFLMIISSVLTLKRNYTCYKFQKYRGEKYI